MLTRVLNAFRMCLHSHTCLPMPKGLWDDDLQIVSGAFLPAVGLAIGVVWWLLALLSRWLLPQFLGAALVALYPFAVTGFENLYAFIRVGASALEKRKLITQDTCQQILPAALMILQFSACLSVDHIFPLMMIPVLSRSCIVLKRLKPKKADEETETEETQVPVSLIRIEQGIAAGALLLMLLFSGLTGLLCGAAVLGVSWAILHVQSRGEAAVESSVCGFALTAAEFCALLILSIL